MICELYAPIVIGKTKYRILKVKDGSIALQSLVESELDQPEEWRTVHTNLTLEQAWRWLRELGLSFKREAWLN